MTRSKKKGKSARGAVAAILILIAGAAAVAVGRWSSCDARQHRDARQPEPFDPSSNAARPAMESASSRAAAGVPSPSAENMVSPSAAAADSAQAAAPTTLDPESMMKQIRAMVKSNPELAESLAREHKRQFPNSTDADERDAFLVAAVFNQRQFDEAKLEAREYLQHHPSGQFAEYVMKLTRIRTRPSHE